MALKGRDRKWNDRKTEVSLYWVIMKKIAENRVYIFKMASPCNYVKEKNGAGSICYETKLSMSEP